MRSCSLPRRSGLVPDILPAPLKIFPGKDQATSQIHTTKINSISPAGPRSVPRARPQPATECRRKFYLRGVRGMRAPFLSLSASKVVPSLTWTK